MNLSPPTEVSEAKGFSSSEYNSVALSAHLRAITLLSNSFDYNPADGVRQEDWKLGYGVRVNSCRYNQDEEYVAAIIKYSMAAKHGRKKIVTCNAVYGVFYDVGFVSSTEAAEAFCNNVGVFAAYPYFRSLVATLLWNAGVDLPPLPAIASTAHIPKKG